MLSKFQFKFLKYIYDGERSARDVLEYLNIEWDELVRRKNSIDNLVHTITDNDHTVLGFGITSEGEMEVEEYQSKKKDQVWTRVIAIIGAVTGVVSLIWLIITTMYF